jgi:multidrug resistance protein
MVHRLRRGLRRSCSPLGKRHILSYVSISLPKPPSPADWLIASLSQIAAELRTTPTIVNLTVALYMLSMSICPLWWSSLSEVFGRRSIYLISFVLFISFAILSARSTSITMLNIMRILSGGAAASVQAVGAGTISDIWKPIERGKAMGLFYLGPLCGPLFAPVIGGALAQRWHWRATMWFIAIYGGKEPSLHEN